MKKQKNGGYSIVLATYKEYLNLKKLLPKLCTMMAKRKVGYEVVIVDDNSQDGIVGLVTTLKKEFPLRIVIRKNERGLASALLTGTRTVRFPNIIRMDADWSHLPSDLDRMLDFYEEQTQPHIVIGSRFVPGSIYLGKPLINQFASIIARTTCRILFRVPVIDLSNDFRILPKKSWKEISHRLSINGNAMLIQEVILLYKLGVPITEIPTTFKERQVGSSKLVLVNEIQRFLTAFPILLRNSFDLD